MTGALKVWLFFLWLVIVGYIFAFMTLNSPYAQAFEINIGGNRLYVSAYNAFLILLTFAIPCLIASILAELTEIVYRKIKRREM